MAPIPYSQLQPRASSSSSSSSFTHKLLSLLTRRQDGSIVSTNYGNINSGPAPGTVVGIVLGSVGGFILLLWLIYTCLNISRVSSSDYTESVVVRERRKSHAGSRRSSRRMSETVEVRRDRAPTPVRIVREPAPMPVRVEPERVIVEERREVRRERERSRGGDDEVVVIEEHSPRRSKSKRSDRGSGFRTVDPLAYGGVVGGGRRGSGSRR